MEELMVRYYKFCEQVRKNKNLFYSTVDAFV